MRREKRSAKMQGYVPPSLRAWYEDFIAPHPNKTISDAVCEALQEYAAIRIAKQKLGARIGQQ